MAVTNILYQTRRWFAFSKIGVCASAKVFEEALNAVKFLGRLKIFGPAQNIMGPVKGQGISIQNTVNLPQNFTVHVVCSGSKDSSLGTTWSLSTNAFFFDGIILLDVDRRPRTGLWTETKNHIQKFQKIWLLYPSFYNKCVATKLLTVFSSYFQAKIALFNLKLHCDFCNFNVKRCRNETLSHIKNISGSCWNENWDCFHPVISEWDMWF